MVRLDELTAEEKAARIREKRRQHYLANREAMRERAMKYFEQNREKVLERNKAYKSMHKAELAAHDGEKVVCECGKIYTRKHRLRHQRGRDHKIWAAARPRAEPSIVVSPALPPSEAQPAVVGAYVVEWT